MPEKTDPTLPDGTIRCFAPAKINLTLHVTGQRNDGYHLLDSLVVFAAVGDRLWLTPGSDLMLEIAGPFAPGVPSDARNLVWQAAELAGWCGHIRLEKHLPHGGGIGGGSADAGAVLRALGVQDGAVSLGADVPVCQFGRAARMLGIGDQIAPAADVMSFFAVLVNPGVHIATPTVFQNLVVKDNPPMPDLPAAGSGDRIWIDWLAAQRNDLEGAARQLAPAIGDVCSALAETDEVLLVRMSGSGSTCFGLYPSMSDAQTAAKALATRHPDWWCVPTVLN
ncbi:4-(cytidine 5'-diphospho)-2-C-methyl-D-erythritol kinase [Roseobacter sinensis]|uniref:4-diphosphocytidyl-2-C-methyl-D-erythritol kinase n=1 Tax=Roseobacter sinensis TaxID=2931391 RepID=A0ABT3BBV0_9RHOB|nr:4-(cytidine 5'-diphospho)-2-C-methyl-D-erythritol kinase [Roseobacter sp. WL0113]MCV3270644.1 4-(cytidine 5'-diphospho)-2-C-methyl-D-erythritol kinase [Roseobacter sp. WL0113]